MEDTYYAIKELDKITQKHNSIQWSARRQEWEEKISGSILKGSGLIHRAIKEQVVGDVPVTKKGQYGTKEIVEEQAEIWAGLWKSERNEEWSDFDQEQVHLPAQLDPETLIGVAASFKK